MTIVGIDLGLRSAYLASIDSDGMLDLDAIVLKPKKCSRDHELSDIYLGVTQFILGQNQSKPISVRIEAPIVAGVRNLQTTIGIAQTSGAVLLACYGIPNEMVAVAQWKKATVGKGNATKDDVARWLQRKHPIYFEQCAGDQNWIDATCIALYGGQYA